MSRLCLLSLDTCPPPPLRKGCSVLISQGPQHGRGEFQHHEVSRCSFGGYWFKCFVDAYCRWGQACKGWWCCATCDEETFGQQKGSASHHILSGLPNANAKSQLLSYAMSKIATLPPVVALNRRSKSQIATRYAVSWHAIPQIALASFL